MTRPTRSSHRDGSADQPAFRLCAGALPPNALAVLAILRQVQQRRPASWKPGELLPQRHRLVPPATALEQAPQPGGRFLVNPVVRPPSALELRHGRVVVTGALEDPAACQMGRPRVRSAIGQEAHEVAKEQDQGEHVLGVVPQERIKEAAIPRAGIVEVPARDLGGLGVRIVEE